jgi:GT2 family glycosyltransferase
MSTAAALDCSIVVVSSNARELTIGCLDSIHRELCAQRRIRAEVVVVDTVSTDRSIEALARHPLKPRLIGLETNVGLSAATNIAVSQSSGRYVLLLGADTAVLHGALARLLDFAERRPDAGIWGGRMVFADGSLNPSSCAATMTPWTLFCRVTGLAALLPSSRLFNGEAYGRWARNTVRRVDIVSGCFMLLRRELWDAAGGLDPQFTTYGGDADLCLRARHLGARPAVTPDATIIHFGGTMPRTCPDNMRAYLGAKALLIERHWSRAVAPLGRMLLATWPLTHWLAHSLVSVGRRTGLSRELANAWRQVWSARAHWGRGYANRSI